MDISGTDDRSDDGITADLELSDRDEFGDFGPFTDEDGEPVAGTADDVAIGALEAARFMSSGGTGSVPRTAGSRPRRRSRVRSREATYSGPRPDDRDPAALGSVLGQVSATLGWSAPLAHARVLGQWAELVGPAIASRCQPTSLAGGELRLSAESTAWATQLRLMAPQILARLATDLPAGTVTKLIISGPSGPSWRRGAWSMSGGRGVRDTYG